MVAQTLMVRLDADHVQHGKLLRTMKKFNEACNHIAGVAFKLHSASKVRLQQEVYYEVRERFGLPAQMTVRAISKTSEAYKRDKNIRPVFKEDGAMVYDQRILSWKGLDRVSILTLDGRAIVPTKLGDYQKARLDRIRGQADLILRKGTFYLCVVVDAPDASPLDPSGSLGVDLGIVNLAVDSDGESYSGKSVDAVRVKMDAIKGKLQRAGTPSAKRHLKKISGKEARFRRNVNHVISKKLVAKAKHTSRVIAIEDLKGIRDRTRVKKRQRGRHSSWAFWQLRFFLEYKSKLAGVPVYIIRPEYTSQTCPVCGCVSKENRPFRGWFECVGCGYAGSADEIAAVNIAARGEVMRPIVADVDSHLLPRSVTSPILQGGVL